MPRTFGDRDEFDPDDDFEGDSDELPEGVYSDDEIPTIECPYCRREISEEAQWCPHCENYLSREDAPHPSRTRFWVLMMLLALAAAVIWVLG